MKHDIHMYMVFIYIYVYMLYTYVYIYMYIECALVVKTYFNGAVWHVLVFQGSVSAK